MIMGVEMHRKVSQIEHETRDQLCNVGKAGHPYSHGRYILLLP
jgi:hypothetical protein